MRRYARQPESTIGDANLHIMPVTIRIIVARKFSSKVNYPHLSDMYNILPIVVV